MQEIIQIFIIFEKIIRNRINSFKFFIIYRTFPPNKLSEKFIEKFQDKVDWDLISEYQKLSECFIRKFQNKVSWDDISACQKLSEDFIEEFQDKVEWFFISQHQKLSEKFILKHWNILNHNLIIVHQKGLTPDFLLWLYRTDQTYDYNLLKKKNDDFLEYSKKIEEEVKIVMIEFE